SEKDRPALEIRAVAVLPARPRDAGHPIERLKSSRSGSWSLYGPAHRASSSVSSNSLLLHSASRHRPRHILLSAYLPKAGDTSPTVWKKKTRRGGDKET